MLLRAIIIVVLSIIVVGCSNDFTVRGTQYKVSELSPAPALAKLGLELRDIGFGIPVHAIDGEVETSNIEVYTTKAINSDEFDLSYFLIVPQPNIKTGENGDFAELLKIVDIIKDGDTSKLTELWNDILMVSFPTSSAKQIELFIDPNKQYIMAIYDDNVSRPTIAYGSNVDKSMILLNVFKKPS